MFSIVPAAIWKQLNSTGRTRFVCRNKNAVVRWPYSNSLISTINYSSTFVMRWAQEEAVHDPQARFFLGLIWRHAQRA